jgi:hypothetical protein
MLFEVSKVVASSDEEEMKPSIQLKIWPAWGACASFSFELAILCNCSTRLLTIELTFFLSLSGEMFLPRNEATWSASDLSPSIVNQFSKSPFSTWNFTEDGSIFFTLAASSSKPFEVPCAVRSIFVLFAIVISLQFLWKSFQVPLLNLHYQPRPTSKPYPLCRRMKAPNFCFYQPMFHPHQKSNYLT